MKLYGPYIAKLSGLNIERFVGRNLQSSESRTTASYTYLIATTIDGVLVVETPRMEIV